MKLHPYLEAAVAAVVDPPDRETLQGGVHAKVELGTSGNTGVALFLADTIAELVAASDRALFTGWCASARTVYERQLRNQVTVVENVPMWSRRSLTLEEREAYERGLTLHAWGFAYRTVEREHLAPALQVGYIAGLVGFDQEMGNGGPYATSAITDAVTRVVALIGHRARAFIVALDRVMLREALRAMLAKRASPHAADVEALLWRAAEDRNVTHALGKLTSGDLILTFKRGRRWEVLAGPRDEVLATIPDTHFAQAVDAVMAR